MVDAYISGDYRGAALQLYPFRRIIRVSKSGTSRCALDVVAVRPGGRVALLKSLAKVHIFILKRRGEERDTALVGVIIGCISMVL